MEKSNYMAFLQEARQFIPQERIYTDELRRLAWGTDAGFYRLIPQIVIRSEGEEEISRQPQPARHFPGSRNQLIRTSHQRLHTYCSRQTLGRLQHISRP
jgi:hypothetical protein